MLFLVNIIFLVVGILATNENIGYYWVITDFHYDDSYSTTQDGCKTDISNPGPFGDYSCDAPWKLVVDSIDAMRYIKPDVDFILWTGDNAAHIPKHLMTIERNMKTISAITTQLQKTFPDTACVPCLGNHDFFPSDQTDGSEAEMYERVCDLWSLWIKDVIQLERCRQGGFFSIKVQPKLRVLSLNTVLYMERNSLTHDGTDPAGQFQWIESVLNASRHVGEKVIVTAHVSPTFLTPPLLEWFQPRHKKTYLQLMTEYADVIVTHHYGHSHLDNFNMLTTEDGSMVAPIFLSPSVSPWSYRSPTENSPRNPGIRLVQYERDSSRQLNYFQYYINVTDSNRDGQTNWTELYNFRDVYGAPDLSATSVQAVFERMRLAPMGEHMTSYCLNLLVSPIQQKERSIVDRAKIWCGGQLTSRTEIDSCVNDFLKDYE